MSETTQMKNSPWFLLWFPPVLFLFVIAAFSIFYGTQAQGNANIIAEKTTAAVPYILITVQALLLIIQFAVFRRQGLTLSQIGWQVQAKQDAWKEILLGAVIGAPLGILWIHIIEPGMSIIQSTVGDYVPAGSLFTALRASVVPFAIADVLLAPFVEENIYRGYAVTKLIRRFSATGTVIITSIFFGLLHWSGGFWYILTTTIIVGVPFAVLRVKRGSIHAVFGAHLALNLVETVSLWLATT
jgi:membrane protease YdiL (CAAX protease family)